MPRILVVDDDDAVRVAIETVLSYEGYDVTVAPGGAAGLKALAQSRFDAVLVDLVMPGMDGWEAIRAFRELAPEVPLIAMSGFLVRDADAPDHLGKLGAAATLHKPFRPKELLRLVEACLARAGKPAMRGSAA